MTNRRRQQSLNSSLVLIAVPTVDVLSLEEAKAALGIATSDQDGMLAAAIAAAAAVLDPAFGGWLGRALRPQTWELRLSGFPNDDAADFSAGSDRGDRIRLPYPVLTALSSVKYDNALGVEQTLVKDTDYRVYGLGGHHRAFVAPLAGTTWPWARRELESVRIQFVCGYAPAVSASPGPVAADKCPPPIRQAIVLASRMLLSNVERNLFIASDKTEGVGETRYVVSDSANRMIEAASSSLLESYRVYG